MYSTSEIADQYGRYQYLQPERYVPNGLYGGTIKEKKTRNGCTLNKRKLIEKPCTKKRTTPHPGDV